MNYFETFAAIKKNAEFDIDYARGRKKEAHVENMIARRKVRDREREVARLEKQIAALKAKG